MSNLRRGLAVAMTAVLTQIIYGWSAAVWAQGQPLTFSAFGDIPYGSSEYGIFRQYVADHNRYSPSAFILHIGDMVSGSCDESKYAEVANIMKGFTVPAYIVVGDNEYSDCSNPPQALSYWKKYFLNFEQNACGAPFSEHQSVREENFAFLWNGVLFIGINLVGGSVHDQNEWNTRMQQDADWISQQFQQKVSQVRAAVVFAQTGNRTAIEPFTKPFRASAAAFGKPVLYIHGDLHTYKYDQPWPEKNITRLEVPKGNAEPPLEVTVTMTTNPPQSAFTVKRNPWGSTPYNMPPCVNAGADQNLAGASATLQGGATDDGDPAGSTLTTMWSKVSGPGSVTFGNLYAFATTASFGIGGTYVLRLTADDGALQKSDDVTITVPPTGPPTTLAIDDVNVNEENSGMIEARFTVSLSNSNGQTVAVNYGTVDGTAIAGDDYIANAGTLTFSGGTNTQTITVNVKGDLNFEPDETFFVHLTNPTNAAIIDDEGQGRISNDDAPPPPGAPRQLMAMPTSGSTIALTWQDQANNENGFKLERMNSDGSFGEIAAVGVNVTSYNDAGLKNGTSYVYRVRAHNENGDSDYSNNAEATTLATTLAVNDVHVNEGDTGTFEASFTVSLSNPDGETVTVEYQTAEGTATAGDDYTAHSGILSFPPGTTELMIQITVNGDLSNESDETFFVNLMNATNAAITDDQGQGVITNDDAPPLAPSHLAATAASGSSLKLTWQDHASNENGFKVERMNSDGSFSEIAVVVAEVTVYRDTGLLNGTSYVYRVRAFNDKGESDYSNNAEAATLATTLSINDVNINEGDSGTLEARFTVSLANPDGQTVTVDYQTADGTAAAGDDYAGNSGTLIFLDGTNTQTIAITINGDAINEGDEMFFVNLLNPANATIADSQGDGVIANDDMPPAAPGQLVATATSSSTIALAWQDLAEDEEGFKIERMMSGGSFAEIAVVAANVVSYNDTGLNSGTPYIYRMRAYNQQGDSEYGNNASAATLGGNTNLVLKKTIVASSTYSGKPAANAVDGSSSSYWRSGKVTSSKPTAWLRVDLGAVMTVGRIVLKWKDNYYAKNYEIQVSNDDVSWTKVYSATGKSGTQNINFSPAAARYVRFYPIKSNKSDYRILEFEVYSGPASAAKSSHDITADAVVPGEFVLEQNFPNPFNPNTTISFGLPQASHVTIKIYTINGQEVRTLVDEAYPAGMHWVNFYARQLPSGTYFYVMQAGAVRQVRRLMLVK